jgi:hypothetical protein
MNKIAKDLLLASTLILSMKANTSILSSDTALLIELVTTTASQLNELEKLVSNAEKYTAKMQKYNELFQDEYFRAERVLYLAESVAAKKEIANLGDLNWAIRELKYSMDEMRELMKEYSLIKKEEKHTKEQVKIEKKVNDRKGKIAQSQVKKAINAKTTGRATQLTAQNTAMIYESNVEMHNTQLEILNRVSTTNRLLAEQLEEKRLEQIQKEQSYGRGQKK